MARQRTQYKLAGRYLRGNDTVYYGLVTADGKEVRATEEVMAYYVGRDQVINVKAQLYKDKVLFRGVGCEIRDLPTIQLGSAGSQPVKPVQPKPVQPKPVQKHRLSDKLIRDISAYTDTNISNTYEDACKDLLSKYSSLAYNLEKTLCFKDMKELGSYIYLYKHVDNIFYILVNIWESNDYVRLAVSESTFKLIRYEYPELVKRYTGDDSEYSDLSKYSYCHYHELIMRVGMFSRIPQYKKLKMRFAHYNKEIFDNLITPKMVLIVGEYKDGTHFDDLVGCAGYSRKATNNINNYPLILVKYSSFRSVDCINNLSRYNLCTLLHEMGHAYVDELYGTNWETKPEDMGDVLYGIDKSKHPKQYRCHGKKFGETMKMVSQKTGFSFDELFGYGVHIDNAGRQTEYTSDLGYEAVKHSDLTDKVYVENKLHNVNDIMYSTSRYRRSFEKIKTSLITNEEYFNKYFREKFNLELKVLVTEDETRLRITDIFNIQRDYDINYNTSSGSACILVYRLISENENYMIYKEYIENSVDKSILKRVLQNVYADITSN